MLTIREVINILIDAPDKDKPFTVECLREDILNSDQEWVRLKLRTLSNTSHYGSVATAELDDGP